MKNFKPIALSLVLVAVLSACGTTTTQSSAGSPTTASSTSSVPANNTTTGTNQTQPGTTNNGMYTRTVLDGTYRGGYIDPSQIEVSFVIKDGKFTEIKYRALGYKGESYLDSENPAHKGIAGQFQALADHLIGKDVSALDDLYTPEKIAKDTDAFSAATVRSSKLISAINDGLNRGRYGLPEATK